MPTPEAIEMTVRRYLSTAASGKGDDIAAICATGATVEDPAGTPAHVGRDEIAGFYQSAKGGAREIERLTLRITADTAAFHFRVTATSKMGDTTIVVEPIDVMTFDEDARITSMRATWSQADLQTL